MLAAAIAFGIGAIGTARAIGQRAFLAAAIMAVLFFQAARMALVVFDPYLSSRPLADALLKAPDGKLIVDHHYYTFSSIFFYTNRDALLLNGRINNLVYGAYAPGAPNIFIDDQEWKNMWLDSAREMLSGCQPFRGSRDSKDWWVADRVEYHRRKRWKAGAFLNQSRLKSELVL